MVPNLYFLSACMDLFWPRFLYPLVFALLFFFHTTCNGENTWHFTVTNSTVTYRAYGLHLPSAFLALLGTYTKEHLQSSSNNINLVINGTEKLLAWLQLALICRLHRRLQCHQSYLSWREIVASDSADWDYVWSAVRSVRRECCIFRRFSPIRTQCGSKRLRESANPDQ